MSSEQDDFAIQCDGLGKAYQFYVNYNDRLRQVLFGRKRKYYREFWVLRGVEMKVRRGESLGIIGRNGSGKTTLLQIVCGITAPTEGTIRTHGRIAPVLALGAGFDYELTGRENAKIGCAILGLSRSEAAERLEAIADFAAVGEFLDQPLKYYSSGMASRLAFAVCAHVDADILVVDEALSVGDEAFCQKCFKFFEEYRKRGTLVFVSHDLGQVAALCDRAVWIDQGRVRVAGDPAATTEAYHEALISEGDRVDRFHIGP